MSTTTSPAAVRPRSDAPTPWRGIAQQALLQLRLLVRSPESLLVTLALPAGALALFGSVDLLATSSGDPVTFLLAGTLAVAVMASGLVAAAIQTAFERQYGVLKLLGATPLPRWGFVLAKTAAVLALVVVQTVALVLIAAVLLGWQAPPDASWAVVAAALVAGALVFTALGQAIAGALPAMVTLATVNAAFVVLLAVAGLVFDADELPSQLADVGGASPAGLLGRVLRSGLAFDAAEVLLPLVGLLGWGAAALALAARTFRWEP